MTRPARIMNGTARPADAALPVDTAPILGSLRLVSSDEYVMRPGLSPVLLRPYWLLELIVEGELELTVDGGPPMKRRAGTGILYLPQSRCRERVPDAIRDCRSQTIIFQDDQDQLRGWLRARGSHVWIEDADDQLRPLMEAAARGFHRGPAGLIGAVGRFYQVISLLLSARHDRGNVLTIEPETAAPQLVLQTDRFMRRRLADPISIRDIAEHLQMSDSGLAHAYRRLTGRTPMAALRAMRVEVARHELLRGRYKLDAIARATGFADASHLSRTFKRLVGRSPRAFLQGNGHGNAGGK